MKNERALFIIVDAVEDSKFLGPSLRSLDRSLKSLPIEVQKILIRKEEDEDDAKLNWHVLDRSWRVLQSRKGVHPLYTALEFLKTVKASPFDFSMLESGCLISQNWLVESLRLLKHKGNHAVIHPELSIGISRSGDRKVLKSVSTTDPRFRSFHAIEKNLWGPLFLAPCEILEKLNLPPKAKGWTQAYWHFYLETLAQDFEHLIAPNTAIFWRQESLSYREFTDPDVERTPFPSSFLNRKFSAPRLLPVEFVSQKKLVPEPVSLPRWAMTESQAVATLVPEWQKLSNSSAPATVIEFEKPSSAFLFESLRDELGQNLDCVLILHQLRRGGAELEALYHIEGIRKIKPDAKIAVLLAYVSDPDWSELLPKDVMIFEYGKLFSRYIDHLSDAEILFKVLLCLQPKIIHVKATELGWNLFKKYGARLSQFSKLYCSLYCIDYTADNLPISFAYSHLPWTYEYLTKIFTDNQALKDHLHETYGYKKIEVLKFPSRAALLPPKVSFSKGENLKILWASRISKQKNIPWLYMIAKTLPNDEFHVYGEFSERIPFVNLLFALKNVIYHGGFDGLDSVPTEQYDIFLYTSAWDGFPNILLEAGLKGLPIISTKVGGITELLNNGNSYLADSYTELLKQVAKLRQEPKIAQQKALRLQDDIRNVHTEAKFFGLLEKEFKEIFTEGRR